MKVADLSTEEKQRMRADKRRRQQIMAMAHLNGFTIRPRKNAPLVKCISIAQQHGRPMRVIWEWVRRGWIPAPDACMNGKPAWTHESLVKWENSGCPKVTPPPAGMFEKSN